MVHQSNYGRKRFPCRPDQQRKQAQLDQSLETAHSGWTKKLRPSSPAGQGGESASKDMQTSEQRRRTVPDLGTRHSRRQSDTGEVL